LLQFSGRGGIFNYKYEQEPAKDTLYVLRVPNRTIKNTGETILSLLRGAGNGSRVLS